MTPSAISGLGVIFLRVHFSIANMRGIFQDKGFDFLLHPPVFPALQTYSQPRTLPHKKHGHETKMNDTRSSFVARRALL
jgi:hypothetical protein